MFAKVCYCFKSLFLNLAVEHEKGFFIFNNCWLPFYMLDMSEVELKNIVRD